MVQNYAIAKQKDKNEIILLYSKEQKLLTV
jgi:hypothetical protein